MANTVQVLMVALMALLPGGVSAQPTSKFVATEGSILRLVYENPVQTVSYETVIIAGSLEVVKSALSNAQPGPLKVSAQVKIPVRSLINDFSRKTERLQEVLKMDPYPWIQFVPVETTVLKVTTNSSLECEIKGDLVVSGITNRISMPIHIAQPKDGRLVASGATKLKITLFNILPPMPPPLLEVFEGPKEWKDCDEVKINFEWHLKEQQPTTQ